jgi:hypothetical protein
VSVANWFQMRDGFGDGARFADGLYKICPDQPANPACGDTKISFDSFRFPFVAFRQGRKRVLVWGKTPWSRPGGVVIEQSRGGKFKRVASLNTDRYGIFERKLKIRRVGGLRAKLADGSIQSLPFSLKRPGDFPISPPVG